jgi:hypothetical protein
MKELIIVKTLAEYIEKVSDSKGWFRGHSNKDYKLIPGIQRFYEKGSSAEKFHEKERYITNDYQSRASSLLREKPSLDDFSAWITLMQHYGLPTRLLDWSRSPLYALYFATLPDNKPQKTDACVWIIDPFELNGYAGLEKETYIYHMQHKIVKNVIRSAFRSYSIPGYDDKIVACYATEADGRVHSQQSAFTVHSSLTQLSEMNELTNGNLLSQIMIPKERKDGIFMALYELGITHSNVFPDLEHVALDIRTKYNLF